MANTHTNTIRTLRKQLAQLAIVSAERDTARRLAEYRADALKRAEEQQKSISALFEAHIIVLQGDRDALTRTIEVLSRRLASPAADRDPSRAGWRAQRELSAYELNQKAESRG